MREVFAFLLIIAASPVLAQEDCDNILTIPELAAQIQEVQVDTVVLQSDGNAEVQLSNGNTYILVLGCTDPAYTEYNSAAIFEDCSCSTPVVEGCTDSDYIEYNASANTDDGSCITLIVEGCTDPTYDEYDASANIDDGSCAILVGCTESGAAGMDGYNYSVVNIGDQCWFAENLRTTAYADGTTIPEVTDSESWSTFPTGKRCDYDNDASNVETSGRLYNWYAATDAAGLCPTGWHVPTFGEWNQLVDYIVAQSPTITSVIGVGEALKSTTGWIENYEGQHTGTDDFGFSALPSGYRPEWGSFSGGPTSYNARAHWWASDTYSTNSFYLVSENFSSYATYPPSTGQSVRCLRDAEWIEIQGCTDRAYLEYDPSANFDDGSCATAAVLGCMDPAYTEYDASVTFDDGSCSTLLGCTDSDYASMDGHNYELVTIDDQCWFAENLRTTVYSDGSAIPEETDHTAWMGSSTGARCDYDNEVSNVEAYGRLYNWYAVTDVAGLCPTGWHVPTIGEWGQLVDYIPSQGVLETGSALKSTSGWGNGNGIDLFGFTALPGGLRQNNFSGAGSIGYWWCSDTGSGALYMYMYDQSSQTHSSWSNAGWSGKSVRCLRDADFSEVQGCTDPEYTEYNAAANADDGSCTTPAVNGCTDPGYDEYDASANTDDGSCATISGCTDPAYDEYDAAANTDDGSCATISGCTDPVYDEYDSSANIDDGSCATISGCTDPAYEEYDASVNTDDGSCATLLVQGCTDPAYTEYDSAANVDDSSCTTLVVEGCTDPVDVNYNVAANTDDGSCASYPCISIEFDGYTYSVVEIGDQCWFAENLRTTVYANGSPIPEVTDNGAWTALSTGARCDYGNNASNVATYGRLYSWYAVDDARGLCPNGWHVPTDEEWTDLEVYISSQGFVGNEGASLRTTSGWTLLNGTDDFGFSALPGGQRWSNADFGDLGFVTRWWSSSINNPLSSWNRSLHPGGPQIFRGSSYNQSGYSVRCLRDAE